MAYKMTPARKAALRRAQQASARKRRGKGKGKLARANRRARRNANIAKAVTAVAVSGAVGAGVYANRGKIKKAASNNPTVRKHMAKKLMRQARARRAKRG